MLKRTEDRQARAPRHFLDLDRLDTGTLRAILDAAHAIKADRAGVRAKAPLANRMLALVFDKPSTRTRVSFDVGMRELGGDTLVLEGEAMQLGRGETMADTGTPTTLTAAESG